MNSWKMMMNLRSLKIKMANLMLKCRKNMIKNFGKLFTLNILIFNREEDWDDEEVDEEFS